MKSEDKLNLTKVFVSGKLLKGTNGKINLRTVKKNAQKIDFLKKYYDVSVSDLKQAHQEKTTRDIIASINDLDGNRVYYQNTEDRDTYVTVDARYGSKEGRINDTFARAVNTALRHSDYQSEDVKALLLSLIEAI